MNPFIDNQVDRAVEGVPAAPLDGTQPQTPFPTSLVLTREQEEALVEHVLARCVTLEGEMGRVIQPAGMAPVPDRNTWMGRRELWTLRYYNHVADRATRGTIFEHSNLTASLSQRITMQMVARANAFYFATDPWFACKPVNHDGDTELEERIDRHLRWKMDAQNLTRTLESAVEFAFVRGEAVTKTTYQVRGQRYKKQGRALFDGATGSMVPDGDGNPIFEHAAWVPEMAPGQPPEASAEMVAMGGAAPAEAPLVETGAEVLKADGVTRKPANPVWQDGLWPVRTTISEGAQCDVVYFKDFLWPLDAPSIHEADICIHLYSLPVMRLVEMFQRDDLKAAGATDLETMQKAVEMVRQMSSGSALQSGAKTPRGDHAEQGNTAPANSPDTNIVEAWVLFDVDGDGIQEEVMIAIDRANRFPVFYDYTANLDSTGRRPFELIRARAVDGRAYGIGAMEYLEPEQEFVDLTINRRNFRMSQAGMVTFWAPHMTMEGRAQPQLKLNHGGTYTLADGFKAEEALVYVRLPDDSGNLMEMLNFYMQLMQLKSGVINAGDQEASGLPSSNTATGINDVAKSGQEMFAQYLSSLRRGVADTLLANVMATYRNMNRAEIFRYFQGDTAGLDSLEPDEVRHLKFMVTILLTRQRTESVLQTSAQASALLKDFYAQPPIIQTNAVEFYREALAALGYNNARTVIAPVPVSNTAPGTPSAQGGIGAAQGGANTGAPAAPPAPLI